MSSTQFQSGEAARLKDMLFGEESRALAEIRERVAAHDARIGSAERMQRSVAEVIAQALRDAQVSQHEQLAAAVSPFVVATVRREILNSRNDLVDALHPMMGHLMSAYVTNGLRDFLHQTDRRLESGLSPRRWRLRIKSALTGVPVAEIVLRERKVAKVSDILLLKRGSGALIDHWRAEPDAAGAQNSALLSGMLAAVTDFAREAFADGKSELRTLDIGAAKVYVRASPAYLIAVKCVGSLSAAAERKIDRVALRAFEDYGDVLASDGRDGDAARRVLPALAARLAEALAPDLTDDALRTGRPRYVMTVLALLCLMGFATAGRTIVKRVEAAAQQREIEKVVAETEAFRGMPVTVRQDNGRFVVAGVAPSREAAAALSKTLQEATNGAPIDVSMATGLVVSSVGLASDAVSSVTDTLSRTVEAVSVATDAAVKHVVDLSSGAVNTASGVVGGAGKTASGAVSDVSAAAVKTVDGVAKTVGAATTQTLGAVEALAQRLASLEASLAASPAGAAAALPSKLSEMEARLEARANERAAAELNERLRALKKTLPDAGPDAAQLRDQVAALQKEVGAARARIKTAAPGATVDTLAALSAKVAGAERDAAVSAANERAALALALPDESAPGGKSDAKRGGGKGKARRADPEDWSFAETPVAFNPEPYSSEATIRDLAARVRGSAAGPRLNGRPMGQVLAEGGPLAAAAPGRLSGPGAAPAGASNPVGAVGGVVNGAVGATQNLLGGVLGGVNATVQGLSGGKK
ncbi:MAG: hypothetical protein NW215_13470 [Hyphomicrobiales bacterium]|nr:hypothetical protein [Hyphomicrobiales bacterium]